MYLRYNCSDHINFFFFSWKYTQKKQEENGINTWGKDKREND